MKKYSFLPLLIVSFIVITISSCKGGSKNDTEIKEAEVLPEDIIELRADQIKLANIETGTIELRSLSCTLKASGIVTTSPQNLATISFPMGGYVKSTALVAGSPVTKGQTLAIIENQDFVDIQQAYLEAKNKLEFAEADYKRHNELFEQDVYSKQNVQQVTADYKSLKAQVKALEQKLLLIGINPNKLNEENISSQVAVISPISGYIKSANINLGKYIAPSDVMFEIVNSDKLLLELTLFDKDANKVSIGQNIRFYINNEAEQHKAQIYQTGKSIGSDKTYKVYANVKGTCKSVLPGMYVNAIIETSDNKVTTLPSESIVSFDDKDYIFVFEKNKEEEGKPFTEYRMVQVQKGFSDNGFTEVKLPEGFDTQKSIVVIKGAYNLLSAKKNAGEMAC
jgi:cobalt-zinc-cadmium efflux system membrane fusion protein